MYSCIIIGISDRRKQWFPPEIMEIISEGTVFSGGKRHYEIMKSYLPAQAKWIEITAPLSEVFGTPHEPALSGYAYGVTHRSTLG